MKTLLRTRCVFVLLSVIWNICLCKMSLCSDSSKNGTSVPVKRGAPASVYLCVQSDHGVYGYIRIHHPSRGRIWYPSITARNDLIHVVRVQDSKSMTVNITITQVVDQDFNGVFTVTMYAKNQSGVNYNDKLEYKFLLIREDEITASTHEPVERTSSPSLIRTTAESTVMDVIPFQATVALSDPQNRAAVTSAVKQRTAAVTSAVKQRTAAVTSAVKPSTSTITSTAATTSKPWCHARENSGCPEKWYPVYGITCLTVIGDTVSDTWKDYCKEYGALMPSQSHIDMLKPCLMYLLQNSSFKTIRLNDTLKSLYDLEGTKVTTKRPYRAACLLEKEKLAQTVVTSFYIEKKNHPTLTHYWRQHLLNTSLNVVTINTKRDKFYFVCTATGYPDPQVQITHNSASLDHKFGVSLIASADCDDSGTYTCQAKNFHSSSQVQKRIQFLRSFEDVSFNITPKRNNIQQLQPGDYVSMRCAVDGCEVPNLLTLTNDIHQTVTYVPSATSLVMNITHLQCSDMGTYYCKAEGQDGHIVQKNVNLVVSRCPVQLCRGEDKSKILSAALHETVSFSLCLISFENPYRDNPQKPTRISVNVQRLTFTDIYWTANITISNIQVSDYGNRSLNINNRHGIFEYHYQLKVPDDIAKSTHELEGFPLTVASLLSTADVYKPGSTLISVTPRMVTVASEHDLSTQGNIHMEVTTGTHTGAVVGAFVGGMTLIILIAIIFIISRRCTSRQNTLHDLTDGYVLQSKPAERRAGTEANYNEVTDRDISNVKSNEEHAYLNQVIYEEIGVSDTNKSGSFPACAEQEYKNMQCGTTHYENIVSSV